MKTIIKLEPTYKNKLHELRLKNQLSQVALAEKAGLHLDTIDAIENGKRNILNCKLGNLLKICNALNCDIYDLID